MNFSLLDKIVSTPAGFIATVIRTEGHGYAKSGARALFAAGDAIPRHGNLGSLCADQELVENGTVACRDGRPRVVRIDTTDAADADVGYGTFCGGVMEVLIEPLSADLRACWEDVRGYLERRERCVLVHRDDGDAPSVHATRPTEEGALLIEEIAPPRRVVIFGATPLARSVIRMLADSAFDAHVVDWRSAYLDACIDAPSARRHLDRFELARDDFVLILSHHYRRDQATLRAALEVPCAYVGLLSSRPRRDHMFEELAAAGVGPASLERVSSPVGLDIGARGDHDIAVAVVAELIKKEAAR